MGLIYILLSLILILCRTAQDHQIHLYYSCFKAQYNGGVTENEPRRNEEAKVRVLERFFVLGDSVIADLVTNHRLKSSRLLVKIVMKAELTAIIERATEGGYWAICPEISGANGQGETIEEAKENLKLAIQLIIEDPMADIRRGITEDAIEETIFNSMKRKELEKKLR